MHSMDRIRRDTIQKYGPAPTTPLEALNHTLALHAGELRLHLGHG